MSLVQTYVRPVYVCVVFSSLHFQPDSVKTVLSCPRDCMGRRRVVVLEQCTDTMLKEVTQELKQHRVPVVLTNNTGVYSAIVERLADFSAVVGTKAVDTFGILKDTRYSLEDVVERLGMDETLLQIHLGSGNTTTIESTAVHADQISNVDTLQWVLPSELTLACLPPRTRITYQSAKTVKRRLQQNTNLLKSLQTAITCEMGTLSSTFEQVEYLQYAYRIKHSPDVVQYPRDHHNQRLVQNLNDRARVFAMNMREPPPTNRRKRVREPVPCNKFREK